MLTIPGQIIVTAASITAGIGANMLVTEELKKIKNSQDSASENLGTPEKARKAISVVKAFGIFGLGCAAAAIASSYTEDKLSNVAEYIPGLHTDEDSDEE